MDEKKQNPDKKRLGLLLFCLILIAIGFLFTQFRTNGRIRSSGQTRKFLVYVPDTFNPNQPAPLVISIHGFVQWPNHQRSMTGWNDLADEKGFLVVYPRGTGFPLRWNSRPIDGDPELMNVELLFFSDLIDDLENTYNIDKSRIYVNGMSNGGGMSDLLACEFSDRIAAIGGVAGAYLYPREDCHPARPVPVIAFHGKDDKIVPYLGGPSARDDQFTFPFVEDWAQNWAEYNSCASTPEKTHLTGEITRTSYADCAENARVIFYGIEGAGHTWPGGEKLPVWIAGFTTQDINATALMWAFFSNYSLDPE